MNKKNEIKVGSLINVYFNLGEDEWVEYNVRLLDWITPLTMNVKREDGVIMYLSGWNKIEAVSKRRFGRLL